MIITEKYGEIDQEKLEEDLFNNVWRNYLWFHGKLSDLWEEYLKFEGYFWDEDKEKWYDENEKKFLDFWGDHDVVAFAEVHLEIPKECLYEWAINEGKIYKEDGFWRFE